MVAFGLAVHEYRGGRVFEHLGTRLLAGILQSLFGIVHNQFFAEGIDEMLGASGNDEFIGILRGEYHGVANEIAP